MSFFGHNNRNDDERITETEQYSTDYDRGYGGRGPREDERFTETTTTSYGGGYGGPPPPPQVQYPWRAQWDDRERRYIVVNEQSGERTWEFPGGQRGYGGGSSYQSEQLEEQRGYGQQEQPKKSHGLLYGAMGAAAGLAGGALLMHEGDKIGDDFERDKYRVEDNFEQDKYRVENGVEDFPENAARWTGEKVGEVEDIPQDIEQGFDRFGNKIENGFDDVVDAPEEVAGWAGRKVGDVERFDDNVDNAYDQGKDDQRYDDNDRNDRW
ncbi:hypothetical protein LTR56_020495 [Elasticomyces elasticus]|nr:hypothetical protein LTR56_020495 [Elasticomyces elasticus]KAK3642726.1 hypothetical protein LTR22_015981 [Elasticomyces elasticus]KAK4910177.1 hypothetical protein LTR49_021143 [Elasticomyces elasticus]KAK5766390.1 hypothetical protein LTS12_003307 [Elasticomyces elasticus]